MAELDSGEWIGGFDDQGSTFDGEGVMRNWWTPQI
jgi:predicted metalloendopeptidase